MSLRRSLLLGTKRPCTLLRHGHFRLRIAVKWHDVRLDMHMMMVTGGGLDKHMMMMIIGDDEKEGAPLPLLRLCAVTFTTKCAKCCKRIKPPFARTTTTERTRTTGASNNHRATIHTVPLHRVPSNAFFRQPPVILQSALTALHFHRRHNSSSINSSQTRHNHHKPHKPDKPFP